ncbi:hypothetical protein NDU88_003175 [Pleurodeles waltl]|uniref:Uncharacterized protein n=1 Tax=Pleurodeles waltl TaxID=8319 RepID=A0AAV7NFY2_PLEWA|nr:hypothetical protein NDU88_003175 [Pleurodeles waltl]
MWPRAQLFLQSSGGIGSRSQQPSNPCPRIRWVQSPFPMVGSVTVGAPVPATASPTENITAPRSEGVTPTPRPTLGVESMLPDIRRTLAVLAAPPKGLPVQASPKPQVVALAVGTASEQVQDTLAPPGASQDPTTQDLLAVSQMLRQREERVQTDDFLCRMPI